MLGSEGLSYNEWLREQSPLLSIALKASMEKLSALLQAWESQHLQVTTMAPSEISRIICLVEDLTARLRHLAISQGMN